jgi:N6-adenosine-specific RNA methylase IME4
MSDIGIADWPFGELCARSFSCIAADAPWTFATRSPKGKGRSAEKHYSCMSLEDIKALPVTDLAARDCCLLLWVTDPMLEQGMMLLKSWGFQYKTVGFYWTKTNHDGSPFTGMGYYTRANPEQCLLATRGNPRRLSRCVRKWIIAPRREHSRKPDEFYHRAAALLPGPHLDLFSREARPGWDAWGNQSGKFSERARQ